MDLLSDIMIFMAAALAALYCLVLSRRLNRFRQLDTGMGSAVAILSAQVDDLTHALDGARAAAQESARELLRLTEQADNGATRLELILASLHDLPEPQAATKNKYHVSRRRQRAEAEAN